MSNFTRVRAVGLWILGSTVDPAEWEEWDGRWEKIPNFTDGSTHAPASQVVIGGAGLEVSGDFIADECSLLHVSNNGAITLGTDAIIELGATGTILMVSGSLISMGSGAVQTVGNGADVNVASGGDLNVQSGGEIHVQSGGLLHVDNSGEINVNSGGKLDCKNGSATFIRSGASFQVDSGGGASFASGSTLTVQCTLTLSGNGAGIVERIGTLSDANGTMGVTKDVWLVPQTVTANRQITLDKTTNPPADGQSIRAVRHRCNSGGATYEFKRESGTVIATMINVAGSPSCWVEFVYRAADTDWRVSRFGMEPLSPVPLTISMPSATY